MHFEESYSWLVQGSRRQRILLALTQPLTVKQLSYRVGLSLSSCTHGLWELRIYRLVRCLNPEARRSRLYWLTDLGSASRAQLGKDLKLPSRPEHVPENVNWNLYGWVCYSHRATVLLNISGPSQPASVQRAAARQHRNTFGEPSSLRMSANNCRDVVKLLAKRGILRPTVVRGKAHTHYELTEVGKRFQDLLQKALGERQR